MAVPHNTFGVCPMERRDAVRVARRLSTGDESLKAQAYGHFAEMADSIVANIDPAGCYEAGTFGELQVLFAQAADRTAVVAWQDASDDAKAAIHEYLLLSGAGIPTDTGVDPGKIRLAQGINTATSTTRRLVQAMPGFIRQQTDFEPLNLGTFEQAAHNSWRVVMDRALLHLESIPHEIRIGHRHNSAGQVNTMSLNADYHSYDPDRIIIETTVPFDEWRTQSFHRVRDEVVVATPAVGCPATLMGPSTVRSIVDIFADVATERNLPQLPRI